MSSSPGIKQNDSFQIECGQVMLMLEQYKLKSNLVNCHMGKEDFKKYFNYINAKSKKRLDFVGGKIMSLLKVFQRNQIYLQALELRTVNNMLRNYRKRMDLQESEQINYSRFDKQEIDLTQIILSNDLSKRDQIMKIMGKVKYLQDERSLDEVMEGILKKKKDFKQYAYSKAFKLISKSEVHYSSYYDNFQLSLSNMVNQIHAHLEKLNKFYTLWENLGSSLIYEIKSNKEVLIDKTLEERRNKYYTYHEEDEDEINQVIDVMPIRSKIRQYYCEKLYDIKSRTGKHFSGGANTSESGPRHRTGNLKEGHQTITKVSWYETNAQDIKDCNFGSEMNTLQEKQQSYFKYTYEQLHKETVEYMEEFKNKKGLNNLNLNGQESYGDRFYVFCQKKNKPSGQETMDTTLNNYGPPQMSFSCWFDRLGAKGVFNVMDYPANLVQRRIQYENDRQIEMENLDDRRRKQYNNKESKLDFLEDQGGLNIGYKYLDSNKELEELRSYIANQYSVDYLPLPKKGEQKFEKANQHSDFSDESQQEQQHFRIQVVKKKQEQLTLPNEGERNVKKQSNTYSRASDMFMKSLKSKALPSKSEEYPGISVKEIKQRYQFVDMQKKQKDTLQLFTQCYLPVFEKSILNKLRSKSKTGIEDEISQNLEYVYLSNFSEGELKSCLNSRVEKDSLNKIYFINKLFYFKIEPLFFTNRGKIIKITFCLAIEIPGFEKLKVNLENIFKPFGPCKFQLNTVFVEKKELSDLNKFYGIIGDLLRNIREEKNRIFVQKVFEKSTEKNQFQKQKEQNEMSLTLISEGEKAYESYRNHCNLLKDFGDKNE